MWTEGCDGLEMCREGLEMMIEGFEMIESYDEESWSNDLSKKISYKMWKNPAKHAALTSALMHKPTADLSKKISYKMRKNPAKYAALTSALMHKPTAAAIDSESAGFDTGAAATGFGIGLVGFLAVAGIAKMLRREQSSKAEQSQECLL